jgi:hypothetical protein
MKATKGIKENKKYERNEGGIKKMKKRRENKK